MSATCSSASTDVPYSYHDASGAALNGSLYHGVCIFPSANCSTRPADAAPCCEATPWLKNSLSLSETLGNYGPFFPLAALYILIPFMMAAGKKRARKEYETARELARAAGEPEPEVPPLLKSEPRKSLKETCGGGKWRTHLFSIFAMSGYIFGIALPIQANIQVCDLPISPYTLPTCSPLLTFSHRV